jgi:hypothetical protein
LNQTITINKKDLTVSFSDYYDSELGEFLFIQVMCDVYMPGNEVVPIEVEKQQIKFILDGFKKRKALYDELKKEDIKGKALYLITPKMRYDLGWMQEKPKLPSSKDPRAMIDPSKSVAVENDFSEASVAQLVQAPERKQPVFTDYRRKYLQTKGFKLNEETNNWEIKDIRFPDSKIDKSKSDEEFEEGMTRLLNASYQNHLKRNAKAPKKD